MAYLAVRFRRGRKIHVVTQGTESANTTLCGRATKAVLSCDELPDCGACLQEMANRAG